MFFDNLTDIPKIAERMGSAIFVVPDEEKIEIKNAFLIEPKGKASISIEQMREARFKTKQTEPRFVVIRPAEKLSEAAENAILKSLEEPEENVHYLLVTEQPHRLLKTILSRAGIYVWRKNMWSLAKVSGKEKTKKLAKELINLSPGELVGFAEKVTKAKDGARGEVLEILAVAIEMCYKTYFLTGKPAYLKKSGKLIEAYDSIAANGQLKLHLVADLI